MGDREVSASDGAGGETSMSTEETNRLRISLGLKPLSIASQPSVLKELEAGQERRKAAEDAEASKALVARLAQAKEKRRQEELLRATKKLGETGEDIGSDTLQWIERSRRMEVERRKKQAAAKPIRAMNELDEDEEDEDASRHTGADLAGFKVKHSVEDLEAGESVILTLEDRGLLDSKGNLVEDDDAALENILVRETKQREKAYRESGKVAKPLWEEDGRQRGLLDKYDEEEEEVLQLGGDGMVKAAPKQQLDVNARLKAGLALLDPVKPASDYYTPEEMEQFKPKKAKKVRKLKKKALTAEEVEALAEGTAAAAAGEDLGSRASREERAAARASAAGDVERERRERFQAALSRANHASLALRNADAQPSTADGDEEDDDAGLAASLHRERLRLLKQGGAAGADPESLADQLRRRRSGRSAMGTEGGPPPDAANQSLVFTGIGEITRSIQVAPGAPAGGSAADGGGAGGGVDRMEVDEPQPPPELPAPLPPDMEDGADGAEPVDAAAEQVEERQVEELQESGYGRWAPVTEGGSAEDAIKEKIKAKIRPPQPKPLAGKEKVTLQRDDVVGDRAIGAGMAGALAFLKTRGDLGTAVEWAGRTNDSKKVNVQGLDEVYSGGRFEDKQALSVEVALTRKDEYGRILTPKELFRQQCHKFHGIFPSQNSKEKKRRKVAEEMARKRAASGAVESGALEQMKQVQRQEALPYIVISGTVRPGQSRDVVAGRGGYDVGDPDLDDDTGADPLAPRLGGGASLPPLTGNAKVAAMLGIARAEDGGQSVARGGASSSRGARGF